MIELLYARRLHQGHNMTIQNKGRLTSTTSMTPKAIDTDAKVQEPTSAQEPPKPPTASSSFSPNSQIGADDVNALQRPATAGASPTQTRIEASGPYSVIPQLKELQFTDDEMAAYNAVNQRLAKANPGLAFVLADPDLFVADMKSRFHEQKQLTPTTPYAFDIKDIAQPCFESMSQQLGEEITKAASLVDDLQQKRDNSWMPSFLQGNKLDEAKAGLAHLKTLKAEVDTHLSAETIPYRRAQELSYFVARSFGMFDMPKIGLRDRLLLRVDRHLQGYQDLKPSQEAAAFKANDFSVFQKQSPVGGFKAAEKSFDEAFFNPDAMDMVSIPTTEHLGPGPFMRLVSYDIYLMGMTQEPASADGFVRPGGDFWVHDVRHASAIFHERQKYEEKHNLGKPQRAKLEKQIDRWKAELDAARKDVPSKELRYAIGFLMFNFHHDRGYPMVPSSYADDTANDRVPRLLYTMLKVSDQPRGFDNADATLNEAFAWLKEFWGQRAGQEQDILQAHQADPMAP